MSGFSEQPFSEYEERYFLAEILKTSIIPPFHLLGFIEQMGVQPLWNEIALPNGRSLSACQRAFTRLRTRQEMGTAMRPQGAPEQFLPLSRPKKRTSAGDLSTPSHPAPGFSSFPSVNNPSPAHGLPSNVSTPGGKPQKKRGRPSKAEYELKVAEAAARGEVYPPPKKIKTPKTAGEEGASLIATGAQDEGSAPGNPAPSETRKRLPKAKAPKEHQPTLQATANAANALGQPSEVPVLETQSTELGHSESLLAGLQEHAARTETNPTDQQQEQQEQQHPSQIQPFPTTQNEPYQTPYQQTSSV
ncbi:hypothetical protein G7Y79_00048g084270 [Physcia stellaris]|nr:hypothetical protein G7Y79_00048g084270 [Physcia stellaris]